MYQTAEFKAGLFEIQDEGAQLIVDRLHSEPYMKILDYCAGSGGKSLSLATQMDNKGLILLHDIRQSALDRAKIRFARHGIQNAKFTTGESLMNRYESRFDLVIADVPCGGSGTLRRNPEMKLQSCGEFLRKIGKTQTEILEKSARFLFSKGVLAYITCSVLEEENQNQIDRFLASHRDFEEVHRQLMTPQSDGHDGFFFSVLRRRSN